MQKTHVERLYVDIPDTDALPERRTLERWSSAETAFIQGITSLIADLHRIDQLIEEERLKLLTAQPFGQRRIDIRWWIASRTDRVDPIPVRYVRNSEVNITQGQPNWRVIRLDRGFTKDATFDSYLRLTGGWANGQERREAVKVARGIESLLVERSARLERVTTLSHSLGLSAAAARRRLFPET